MYGPIKQYDALLVDIKRQISWIKIFGKYFGSE
jgi:hypothetical protein